ncbi:MAG TPA: efflux transporter outer membrane subunit [Alphaproteobacteria bacterium]|nr:efflux transporter outer membrane subunit [Alphaproteobacteria bacterium]
MRLAARLATFAIAGLVAGCAVGPDFQRPPSPNIQTYEKQKLPAKTVATSGVPGGAAQSFARGTEVPAAWWESFGSQPLDRLIAASFKANPDLKAEEAALRAAHEDVLAGNGALYPSVDAGASVTREKENSIAFGGSNNIPAFTLYNAHVTVSYAADVFGLARRTIEELRAQEDVQRFQLEAARISLAANVATAAIAEASLRGQIAATQSIVKNEHDQLALLQKQFTFGGIAQSAVLAQETTLAEAEATLPGLEKQLAITRHQLAALAGRFPSEGTDAKFELASLTLPRELPVSLPSRLIEQRPDVRAAEAALHAASAAVGVATANMFPQFPLTADLGSDAGKLGNLFASGTGIWSLIGGITQPLFEGGRLRHERKAAVASFDQAAAQYRKTVLAAFQNVADTLRALQLDAETLKADADAEQAAGGSLKLAEAQYKDGAVSYLALLSAEQAEQQARLALVQAEAARYADTVALFQALGGGWWNRPAASNASTAASPASGAPASLLHKDDAKDIKKNGADAPAKADKTDLDTAPRAVPATPAPEASPPAAPILWGDKPTNAARDCRRIFA